MSKSFKRFLLVVLASAASLAQAAPYFVSNEDPKPTGMAWQAVENMSDDFDDGSIDLSKWQIEPEGNGWSWIGRAPGLFKADNVTEANGRLSVTVSELPSPQTINGNQYLYQGAIVRSINPGQVGWYFEAKMKANATTMSSTFWLMTKYNCEKKLETDIQECVGRTTELTQNFAKNWDEIYHSNAIHRSTNCNPAAVQRQGSIRTDVKNHERFFVYGAWWKSKDEVQFFLDGEYVYSIFPSVDWDVPAFIQMAIETYDWNPVPADGGLVKSGTWEQRTTQYEWVRVWQLSESIAVDAGEDQNVILPTTQATLNGSASDPSVVDTYQWTQLAGPNTASLSGATTPTLSASGLIAGQYIFELTVTDLEAQSFSDQVSVQVSPNTIPAIQTFQLNYGATGSAYSQEIQINSGDAPFSWSIADGALPAGLSLTNGTISGTPTAVQSARFTVRVQDVNGDSDEQALRLRTVADLPGGTASFTPIHDAYIESTNPLNNQLIKIENGRRVGYLQFQVTGVSGQVETALLSMQVVTDGGNGTLRFYEGSHSNWTESTLSNTNKPSKGSELATLSGAFTIGNTYSVNLASLINSDGTYTLVIEMDSGGNDAWFSSREGSSPPNLVITTQAPADNYTFWAQFQFDDLAGNETHPLAAFDARRSPSSLSNGLLYTYDADLTDSAEVQAMLPHIVDNSLRFTLPATVPNDIGMSLQTTDSLRTWPTSYPRNSDGTWPAPLIVNDNEDGTHTITLPRGTAPSAFYRLQISKD